MAARLKTCIDNKKHPIIQDLQGRANVYFQYSCNLVDITAPLKKLLMKIAEPADVKKEVIEKIRATLVHTMRNNGQICIYTGDLKCDLMMFNDERDLPLSLLLDWDKGHKHENYIGMIRDEEKYDHISGVVDGKFFAQDRYSVCVLTDLKEPEDVKFMM